jgi:hypothetical protein
MRTTLEAAKQYAEDRATTAQSAAAAAVIERDSLASRLALAEAEVEKLRVAAASTEEAAERARAATATTEVAARDTAQATAREKATLKARVSELSATWALPRRVWRRAAASSPWSPISFRRSPRRRHDYAKATPSCRRASMVSQVDAFLLHPHHRSLFVVL